MDRGKSRIFGGKNGFSDFPGPDIFKLLIVHIQSTDLDTHISK